MPLPSPRASALYDGVCAAAPYGVGAAAAQAEAAAWGVAAAGVPPRLDRTAASCRRTASSSLSSDSCFRRSVWSDSSAASRLERKGEGKRDIGRRCQEGRAARYKHLRCGRNGAQLRR